MTRIGIVLAVRDGQAQIETARRGICDGCDDQAKCAVDGATSNENSELVLAHNPLRALPGERVEFELPGHTELKVSFLVWIVPLIGLLGGAILGANLHEQLSISRDSATLVGLLLGAGLAFGLVMGIDRRMRGHTNLVPKIVKVLQSDVCSLPSHVADSSSVSRRTGS